MEDYLTKFNAMVEELKAHPKIEVTHFNVFPPITERAVLRATHEFGAAIPEEFLQFYRVTSGLQLRWLHRDSPHFEKDLEEGKKYSELSYESVYRDDGSATGCINIQPFADIFGHSGMWEGQVYFEDPKNRYTINWDGQQYSDTPFRKSLKPLDYFHFWECILLLTYNKTENLPLAYSSSYFKNLSHAGFSNFEDYLAFLLATKGYVKARSESDAFELSPKVNEMGVHSYRILDVDALIYDENEGQMIMENSFLNSSTQILKI